MENNFNSFEKLPEAVNYLIAEISEMKKLLVTAQKPTEIKKRVPIGINEVCELLHKAKPTIYSLVQQRILPCYKTTKNLYFYEDEILSWLESGRRKTGKELKTEAEEYSMKRRR